MTTAYLDDPKLTSRIQRRLMARTDEYRATLAALRETPDTSRPEYALFHATPAMVQEITATVTNRIGRVRQLVLIGTGGSSLGTEALHAALGPGKVELTVVDVLSPQALNDTIASLRRLRSCESLAISIVSKSGTTTETVVNASVLLTALVAHFGTTLYERVITISDPDTPLQRYAKRQGALALTMPAAVGGRYSVGTEVGLVPLHLLGHNVSAIAAGLNAATDEAALTTAGADAARLAWYITKGYQHYNFFAFSPALATLGAWYRQLQAESLGKATTQNGKPLRRGMVPTISTPTELHSMGQLYLSGYAGVYTDFVAFAEESTDQPIPRTGLAKAYARHTVADVATALYGGVLAAYQERQLPYRSHLLAADPTALGKFMGQRMIEVMCAAVLLEVAAFTQPNVELYKSKTRSLLGL